MLYRILKIWVTFCLHIFFRKIIVSHHAELRSNGPLLIAANHPNSFLDALIIDILFKQPVWSLARGDVFRKKWIIRVLTSLRILPVYRISEGVENLNANYETFEACKKIFRENGLVLIFSEGLCVNEWHLRPLKKGTARLAISSWNENIPVEILPVGINYSKFFDIGQDVHVMIGNRIKQGDFDYLDTDGNLNRRFNERLSAALQPLVLEIDSPAGVQPPSLKRVVSPIQTIIYLLPALAGIALHIIWYAPILSISRKKAAGTGHFDSILAALLMITYPFYIVAAVVLAWLLSGSPISLLLVAVMPFTAFAFTRIRSSLLN